MNQEPTPKSRTHLDLRPRKRTRLSPFLPVATAVLQHPLLGPCAALVHGYVWSFHKSGKGCYASIDTIALETGLSKATVKRAIHELEEHGFLEASRRQRSSGADTTNAYFACLPGDDEDEWGGSK